MIPQKTQKKECPKCKQFMLLKRIDKLTYRMQWECPWCDHTESYQIEKPANVTPTISVPTVNSSSPVTIKRPTLGFNGRCKLKDFKFRADDCWKCVDIRVKDEINRDQARLYEYNVFKRNNDYFSVCKFCRHSERLEDDVPVAPVIEPVKQEPAADQPAPKPGNRFTDLDLL